MDIIIKSGDKKDMYLDVISKYQSFFDEAKEGKVVEELYFLTPTETVIGRGNDPNADLNSGDSTSAKTMVMDEGSLIIKYVHKGNEPLIVNKIITVLTELGINNVTTTNDQDVLIDGKKVLGSSHIKHDEYCFEMCNLNISTDVQKVYSNLQAHEQQRIIDDSIRNVVFFKPDFNKDEFIDKLSKLCA
jgi:hypothetical protein